MLGLGVVEQDLKINLCQGPNVAQYFRVDTLDRVAALTAVYLRQQNQFSG